MLANSVMIDIKFHLLFLFNQETIAKAINTTIHRAKTTDSTLAKTILVAAVVH